MKRIMLTDELRRRLNGLSQRVHLCDEDGFLLVTIELTSENDAEANIVTLDDELSRILGDLGTGIEFCDESGELIAKIAPCLNGDDWDRPSTSSLEDFKRRRAAGERAYTTSEVVEMLRSL